MGIVRILFLADTHLGFDFPFRPRIQRRRRGPDFFSNFEKALAPALTNEVDCVVHGGDLLYRSKVPPQLVEMAFAKISSACWTEPAGERLRRMAIFCASTSQLTGPPSDRAISGFATPTTSSAKDERCRT